MRWRKVTLVGVGLLGGSLGLALRRRAQAERVEGYVRREASIAECVHAGAVDSATCDLLAAVSGAELIVFCTPLWQMGPLARKIASTVSPTAIVTDVGSVKQALVDEFEPLFPRFVGSHPMAGSERMGVSAAREDLFEKACCIVTPTPKSDRAAVARVEELWRSVGARPLLMGADLHDQLVARSSHLPHVLAAHLASYVLDARHPAEQQRVCAGGFRDSTRVASGSPEMWRDIVTMNRTQVAEAARDFRGLLDGFLEMLERNDPAEIEAFFRSAKTRRDDWGAQCTPNSPE